MSLTIAGVLLVSLLLVMVPVTVMLVQVVSAVIPPRKFTQPRDAVRPRLAVLVPAHNESVGVVATLNSVLAQFKEGDRLLVVADNCTDDTGAVARAAGAEVLERHDDSRRGKGYALDFGMRHLERDPPQLVIIVDADCQVTAGAIERIAMLSATTGRPVQALYLMTHAGPARPMAQIAEFAWVVKNLVRPLGYHHLGLPCQLMGTGMAFPWAAICNADLASGHIVEDMKLGADLARAGTPPLFCPDALVLSAFPGSEEGTRDQRTRWEHGHLSMIFGAVPRMLFDGARGRGSGLLALGLDLLVPPLSLLGLLIVLLFGIGALLALATPAIAPLALATAILLMFVAAMALSWLRFGMDIVSPATALLAFGYALRKIPLYLKFLVRRQVEWVRSKRDGN